MSEIDHYMESCGRLSREVTKLEADNAALKAEVEQLRARVGELETHLEIDGSETRRLYRVIGARVRP